MDALETPMSQRLEQFLASVEPDHRPSVLSCRAIAGGYSRATALAEVRWADGVEEKLVLRADPPAGQGVFLSERDPEWQLLRALSKVDNLVVPTPRWYDSTGAHLGSKCIIMDHCDGVPLQSTLQGRDDLSAAIAVFIEVGAAIHSTPLDALPSTMQRPADWETYLDGAIEIYERTERDHCDSSPVIRYVGAWLRAHRPPPVPLALVHGDFQPGNILVADGRPPVVIDWEFTRIGDPREDIGYYSQSPLAPNLFGIDPDGFLKRYRQLSGLSESQLNTEIVEYFFILGMAKLFAQMMEGAGAVAGGRAKGVMNAFLINSLSYFHEKYLLICNKSLGRV